MQSAPSPAPRLRLHELTPGEADLLDGFWFPLYRRAFPPEERGDESVIRGFLTRPDRRLFAGIDTTTAAPVALARLDDARPEGVAPFAHLVYLATDDSRRGTGLGGEMLRLVEEYARRERAAGWLVLEAESPHVVRQMHPDRPETVELARRRLGFYERHGYKALSGVRYLLTIAAPAPDAPRPGQPLELLLLARSLDGAKPLTADSAYEGCRALWGDAAVLPTGPFTFVPPTTLAAP